GCAPILPDDCVVDGLTGLAIPEERGLTLVGDANGGDVGCGEAGLFQRGVRGFELGLPDLVGVVFDPAGLREDLPEILLRNGADGAVVVEDDGSGARGALVERE